MLALSIIGSWLSFLLICLAVAALVIYVSEV